LRRTIPEPPLELDEEFEPSVPEELEEFEPAVAEEVEEFEPIVPEEFEALVVVLPEPEAVVPVDDVPLLAATDPLAVPDEARVLECPEDEAPVAVEATVEPVEAPAEPLEELEPPLEPEQATAPKAIASGSAARPTFRSDMEPLSPVKTNSPI
jgi:hypothetical protein